jgi:hypothetical protein
MSSELADDAAYGMMDAATAGAVALKLKADRSAASELRAARAMVFSR